VEAPSCFNFAVPFVMRLSRRTPQTGGKPSDARGAAIPSRRRMGQRPGLHGLSDADQWIVHVPAFPGRRVIRLVQQLAKRPSFLAAPGRAQVVGRQALACPKCDRLVKRRSGRWLTKSDWRSIGIALIVVVGVPAAVIFFLVVVCAPRGH